MSRPQRLQFDEIGYWSEVKLDIVRKYAAAYSRILAAQTNPHLEHVYVDAFAGAGIHVSRQTGEFVPGSPLNALLIQPPFRAYHLIDIDGQKVALLRELAAGRQDVRIHEGDCNAILLDKVFPQIRWEDYRRGLCLLDPYGLHLDWRVVATAGQMRSIELFINFPVADMNRNVLWRNPDGVDAADLERMTRFWGDDSWRQVAYRSERGLFGDMIEKEDNEIVAEGFRQRLQDAAGFQHVPKPMPMRNSKGAVVYYLFFAAHKPVAADIVKDIFKKYHQRGTP
ncbi:MAG: three-Cys-motif partner protein TcmP [Verrucomicrobiae bacterium]|nr:three-Cys-motif partner protein TcmP [Verrucomicrobiae bacterium]